MRVHFIGIGGIGMSALARLFLSQKWLVSGSDAVESDITRELKKEGVLVKIGHRASNLSPAINLVIHSQAVPLDNPEVLRAKKLGIRIQSFPEAVGEVTEKYETIAIAGAHGKSTTTAMTALILAEGGFNPTVLIGTKVKEFGNKNFRAGGKYLVLEADEYRGAFLHHSHAHAIITNIDREHLDCFKNLAGVKKVFMEFIGRVRAGGFLVLNKDDANLRSMRVSIRKIAGKHSLKAIWYSAVDPCWSLPRIPMRGGNDKGGLALRLRETLRVPGEHNFLNALAAFTLARALGVPEKTILQALGAFMGTWRRMERRGEFRVASSELRVPVYDDYGHHPTEIRATLQAFREKYPRHKLICVFQPHQAERLRLLFGEFARAFEGADITVILPVYRVAGRDIMNTRYTAEALAKKARAQYLPSPIRIRGFLECIVRKDGGKKYVIVMMGAGDVVEYTKALLA